MQLDWRFLTGFRKHVVESFNKRCMEMDHPLCRLALVVDPRYRDAAIGWSSWTDIVTMVRYKLV